MPDVVHIPDTSISQDAIRIYSETKLFDTLNSDQIRRHAESLSRLAPSNMSRPILVRRDCLPPHMCYCEVGLGGGG